jgi:hypothetical protein
MYEYEKGSQMTASPDVDSFLQRKVREFNLQYQIVYEFFSECPKTMKQVSVETSIDRSNICRYVAVMEKKGEISLSYKGTCPITGMQAGFYLTNKDVKPSGYSSSLIEAKEGLNSRYANNASSSIAKPNQDVFPQKAFSGSALNEFKKDGDFRFNLFNLSCYE